MEISVTPRNLQEGRITNIDVSEIKEEMYLAYIVHETYKHKDLRIDSNSYKKFFYLEREGTSKLEKWLNDNKDIVKSLNQKYQREANIYYRIYDIYEKEDFGVGANYRMLKTAIPKVDAFIAKETLLQVIYNTMKHGNCRDACQCFYYVSTEEINSVKDKLKSLLDIELQALVEIQEQLSN